LRWLGGAGAAGGSRRPRRLTESRLAQWPQRTVTVLNRLLQGTPTCARMHIEIEERRISQYCVRCWLAAALARRRSGRGWCVRASVGIGESGAPHARTARMVSQQLQCT
jgi:hypothetical protein